MNAALRCISGDGEWEKWWKRLLDCKRTLPETVGELFARPEVLVPVDHLWRFVLCILEK